MSEIPEGMIDLDSRIGKQLGFTSDKFDGWLWCKDGFIWISYIRALTPGNGDFSKLVKSILDHEYGVKVPTPFPRMEAILQHLGFEHTRELFENFEEMGDVWVLRKGASDEGT